WSKVIVREHSAQRAVHAVVVERVVRVPALHGGLRAERTEERMRLRFRTSKRAVTRGARILASTSILFANRADAFDHFLPTERAVFLVETIARAVSRGHVTLPEV